MGVGKGTVARAFAKRYGVFNIDTDDLVESYANKEVKKIFAKKGEEHFRKLEQSVAKWLRKSVNGTLISCGGGFYKVDKLDEIGTVVLLDASFEWIHSRLKNAKNPEEKLAKRPLFGNINKAQTLYNERKKAYNEIADAIIKVEGKSMDEICEEVERIANT